MRKSVEYFSHILLIVILIPSGLQGREHVQRVVGVEKIGDQLRLELITEHDTRSYLTFKACTPDIIRMRISAREEFATPALTELGFVKAQWGGSDVTFTEERNGILFRTDSLQVRVTRNPFHVEFTRVDGHPLLAGHRPGIISEGETWRLTWKMEKDEGFYGFGEKFNSLNQRGREVPIWVTDVDGYFGERSNVPIPFFMSTRNYGIFLNTAYRSHFDMGDMEASKFIYDSYTFSAEGGQIEFYFIHGSDMKQILSRYTEITGRAPLPPLSAMGYWHVVSHNQERILSDARRIREFGIPCEAIKMDAPWMEKRGKDGYTDMQWAPERFPNPDSMIRELTEMHYEFGLWECNLIETNCVTYAEGKRKGYFVKNDQGEVYHQHLWKTPDPEALIDFTNPGAAEWWWDINARLMDQGVDHFKLDHGEEAPEDGFYHSGRSGNQMHNLYPLLYIKTIYEGTEAYTGKRAIIRTRTGYVGSQRYPGIWPADQQQAFDKPPYANRSALATQIKAVQSIGMSGFPYWDYGLGPFGNTQLMVRGIQFGTFTPLQEIYSNNLFGYDSTALRIMKRYIELRYRLLPYLYTYARESHDTGLPVVRAMALAFPDDSTARTRELQYMYGESFLVAPVYSPSEREDRSVTHEVYLPEGKWIDYWTEEVYSGPKTLSYQAQFDRLPLFVRMGSIIPMRPAMDYIGQISNPQLIVHLYPSDCSTSFTLYSDDGESFRYREGDYSERTIQIAKTAPGMEVQVGGANDTYHGQPGKREITLHLHQVQEVETVEIGGTPIPRGQSTGALKRRQPVWYYDRDNQELYIALGSLPVRESRLVKIR